MDFELPSILLVCDVEIWFGVLEVGELTGHYLKGRELGRGIREGMRVGTIIYS